MYAASAAPPNFGPSPRHRRSSIASRRAAGGMEADSAHRYRSRILREMNANRANPFNSPPSSTGSHGTVSPTVSSVFSDPDGESTRRLNQDIARVTAPRKLPVNWEAAHRKWPEFFSMPKHSDAPLAKDGERARRLSSKENKPPPSPAVRFVDDSTQEVWQGSTKTRAEMQPRVDNDSDLPSILSRSPTRTISHHVTAAKGARNPSPLTNAHARNPSRPNHQPLQRRPSISEALDRLRKASLSPEVGGETERLRQSADSPNLSSSPKSSLTAVPSSPNSMSPGHNTTSNIRSFFMPDVSHLGDFVTGTLKFSGSMKNGVPIFVKHGRVHDRQERTSAGAHAEIDGIEVPEDEEKIFVSMDMIRDEIISLQEHHDKVHEYAENLQQRVERLEAQLKSRNHNTNGGGASYEHHNDEKLVARKNQLEIEVATLQARLDEAQRKIGDNELEKVSLSHERDRAVGRLQSACDDISKLTRKLNVKEKELESSHKQLETTDQMREDNDTLRRDLVSLKHGRDALELKNTSLRAENEALRKEKQDLMEEIESLRSDNNSLRRGDDSLISENRSLRSNNKSLMEENEDLRENLDGLQHELDAAREEVDVLRRRVEAIDQENVALREDNESLVRHNGKYFSENKMLRRENSAFERSIRDLHDENVKISEEVGSLKQQLDHCRPLPKDDLSARLDDGTEEENMTSAFFVPDITINTNGSDPAEATETIEMPAPPELTSQSQKTPAVRADTEQDIRDMTERETQRQKPKGKNKTASAKNATQGQQKVAFSIPEKFTQSDKNVANKGSKRRNRTQEFADAADPDETTGLHSIDNATQDQAIPLDLPSLQEQRKPRRHRDITSQSQKSSQQAHVSIWPSQPFVETNVTAAGSGKRVVDKSSSCPALSSDARRILDGLCKHNCRNCIVCSRITSHRGVISSAEVASGKKHVTVPRPVPVTDRNLADQDATVRPSQPPGHALALVIKGLEDEAQHLQLELSNLQAQYDGSDKALGRRRRLGIAEGIRTLLKRLEVKNDQIYSLYDVLEGQKAAGQAMTEEEVEMTVLNITGMTVRDVTGGSEQFAWQHVAA